MDSFTRPQPADAAAAGAPLPAGRLALSLGGVLLFLACGPACGLAGAEEWPAWRGPLGNGVSAEKGLPLTWGRDHNLRWRVPLPDRGNSTPAIWGGRVFVTQAVEEGRRRTLMCFGRADGRLLWQSGVTYRGREPTNGQNPYCSASPATDGRRVVAYFGSAGLYCYDFDGKELWRRDVGEVDSWQGSGSSPVIHGNLCFLNAGPGTDAALLACDMGTGEVVWKVIPPGTPPKPKPAAGNAKQTEAPAGGSEQSARPAPPPPARGFDNAMEAADPSGAGGYLGSWSTPVVIRSGGDNPRDELVVVHGLQVSGYDPKTGKELWVCKGLPEQAFASPAVGGGVLVASGHKVTGGGTRVTAVRLGGAAGDVTATHRLWQTDLPKEVVGSGVVAGGHVYLVTQFGSVVCLDLATGKKQWEKRLSGEGAVSGSWSSIVLADGKLLVPNHAGEVFVLRASPRFELLATNWGGEESTCASPAVSRGHFFLRTHKAIWCFGGPGE